MNTPRGIILGSRDDVHVQRVLDLASVDHLVVDAKTLSSSAVAVDLNSMVIRTEDEEWRVSTDGPQARGWVRRLAPEDWQDGIETGSMEAAEQSAWLSLVGAIGRSPLLHWLTSVDRGLIAENKHYQLVEAKSLGVPVPNTLVTNSPSMVPGQLPGDRVVKTLGRAHYMDGADSRVVFSQTISDSALAMLDADVPLIYQERLHARSHLRVVIVRDRVWTCELAADDLPLDWRTEASAHDSFALVATPAQLGLWAVAVCRALQLGYASQDWILTDEGPVLLDVNPGGQWLFLPEPVRTEVASAIVDWLEGR